jgi:YD repeat-containing protein
VLRGWWGTRHKPRRDSRPRLSGRAQFGGILTPTGRRHLFSLTYDALGRMVEQNRSERTLKLSTRPGGTKLALMTGQTLQKAFVSLPGGGTAVFNSSGLAYYRSGLAALAQPFELASRLPLKISFRRRGRTRLGTWARH